jgi:hypothetical protein
MGKLAPPEGYSDPDDEKEKEPKSLVPEGYSEVEEDEESTPTATKSLFSGKKAGEAPEVGWKANVLKTFLSPSTYGKQIAHDVPLDARESLIPKGYSDPEMEAPDSAERTRLFQKRRQGLIAKRLDSMRRFGPQAPIVPPEEASIAGPPVPPLVERYNRTLAEAQAEQPQVEVPPVPPTRDEMRENVVQAKLAQAQRAVRSLAQPPTLPDQPDQSPLDVAALAGRLAATPAAQTPEVQAAAGAAHSAYGAVAPALDTPVHELVAQGVSGGLRTLGLPGLADVVGELPGAAKEALAERMKVLHDEGGALSGIATGTEVAGKTLEGFSTPRGVATMGALAVPGVGEAMTAEMLFGLAKDQVPEIGYQYVLNRKVPVKAAAEALVTALMAAEMMHSRSRNREATPELRAAATKAVETLRTEDDVKAAAARQEAPGAPTAAAPAEPLPAPIAAAQGGEAAPAGPILPPDAGSPPAPEAALPGRQPGVEEGAGVRPQEPGLRGGADQAVPAGAGTAPPAVDPRTLPVDEAGAPITVYRGEGSRAADTTGRKPSHLAGSHWTEDADYARIHAGENGHLREATLTLKRPFDMDGVVPAEEAQTILGPQAGEMPGGLVHKALRDEYLQGAEDPTDDDLRAAIAMSAEVLKAHGYDSYAYTVRTPEGRVARAWAAFDEAAVSEPGRAEKAAEPRPEGVERRGPRMPTEDVRAAVQRNLDEQRGATGGREARVRELVEMAQKIEPRGLSERAEVRRNGPVTKEDIEAAARAIVEEEQGGRETGAQGPEHEAVPEGDRGEGDAARVAGEEAAGHGEERGPGGRVPAAEPAAEGGERAGGAPGGRPGGGAEAAAEVGELRPEPHEMGSAPEAGTAGMDRWEADRGAMPGEPEFTLDGGRGDGKAALIEVEEDGRPGYAVWEARGGGGEDLGRFSNLEDAARRAEQWADKEREKATEVPRETPEQKPSRWRARVEQRRRAAIATKTRQNVRDEAVKAKMGTPAQVDAWMKTVDRTAAYWAKHNPGKRAEDFYAEKMAGVTREAPETAAVNQPVYQHGIAAPTFFSQAIRTIEQKMPERAAPEQVRGILSPANGVKPEELQWLGLDDVLSGKAKVTKAEVLEHLRANQVEVKPVVHGGKNNASPEQTEEIDTLQGRMNDLEVQLDDVRRRQQIVRREREQNAGRPSSRDWTEELATLGQEAEDTISEQRDTLDTLQRRRRWLEGENDTKFGKYTLPGGENYREVLLTKPEGRPTDNERVRLVQEFPGVWRSAEYNPDGEFSGYVTGPMSTRIAAERAREAYLREYHGGGAPEPFRSSHFDEPNVLAHLRLNDRVDAEGKKTLFVEEIQSDWHQKGHEEGYQNPGRLDALDAKLKRDGKLSPEEAAEYKTLTDREAFPASKGGVPNAPFKKTWPELAFKWALRHAVENGYDKVAWTTGEQQAERYDLSKQLNSVVWHPEGRKNGGRLLAFDKTANQVIDADLATDAELVDHVGKDLAQKLIEGSDNRKRGVMLEGLDLKVGGEGMKGFYDQILPATVNKLVKKWGGKVEETEISGPSTEVWTVRDRAGRSVPYRDENGASVYFPTEASAVAAARETDGTLSKTLRDEAAVHSLEITPAMREGVEGGMPLFQGKGKPKGALSFLEDGRALIHAMEKPDISTLLHEGTHLFESVLSPKDRATVEKVYGENALSTTKGKERFAEDGERYFASGKSPVPEMKSVFEKFRDWLTDIYKGVKGSLLGKKIHPEIEKVFNKWMRGGEEPKVAGVGDTVSYRSKLWRVERQEGDYLLHLRRVTSGGKLGPERAKLDIRTAAPSDVAPMAVEPRAEGFKTSQSARLAATLPPEVRGIEIPDPMLHAMNGLETEAEARAVRDQLVERRRAFDPATFDSPKEAARYEKLLKAMLHVADRRATELRLGLAPEGSLASRILAVYSDRRAEKGGRGGSIPADEEGVEGTGARAEELAFPDERLPGEAAERGEHPDERPVQEAGVQLPPAAGREPRGDQRGAAAESSEARVPGRPERAVPAQGHVAEFRAEPSASAVPKESPRVLDRKPRTPRSSMPTDEPVILARPFAGKEKRIGQVVMRATLAEKARRHDVEAKAMEEWDRYFDKPGRTVPEGRVEEIAQAWEGKGKKAEAKALRDHVEQVDFIDRIESGRPQRTFRAQQVADYLKAAWDARKDEIAALGMEAAKTWHLDYFPHIWEDPKRMKDAVLGMLGRRPLEGSKGFAKHRTFLTTMDGLEAGFVPVDWNPVRLSMLKMHEMDRYITARKMLGDLDRLGMKKFVGIGAQAPEGWRVPKDNAFQVFKSPEIAVKEARDAALMESLKNFAESLGVKLETRNSLRSGRWGEAHGDQEVRRRFGGPEFVVTHEIGHVLDKRFHLYDKLKAADPGIEGELSKLAEARIGEETPEQDALERRKFQEYVQRPDELVANLVHAFIHAPELVKETAPKAAAEIRRLAEEDPALKPLLSIKPSLRLQESTSTVNAGGIVKTGGYAVPGPVADLLDRHLTPSLLSGSKTFDAYRKTSQALLMARLGWSGFHLGFTTGDVTLSRLALAGRQASRGDLAGAVKAVGSIPQVFSGWVKDNPYLKEWYAPGTQGDDVGAIVKALEMGGGRARQGGVHDMGGWEGFFRELRKAGIGNESGKLARTGDMLAHPGTLAATAARHPWKATQALVEAGSRYILNDIVPRQKLAIAAQMAEPELRAFQKETGKATLREALDAANPERVKDVMARVWDSVDNRLGQVVYDNLFLNRTLRDALHASVQSVGWNLGTLRELGGGVKDVGNLFKPETDVTGRALPRVTHRLAYTVALPFFHALLSSAIQYAYTGKGPEEPKDLVFPKTGRLNADGSAARLSPATYMKDVYAYLGGFLGEGGGIDRGIDQIATTVSHKVNPMLSMLAEIGKNEDFYGTEIRHKGAPVAEQLADLARYVIAGVHPYSLTGYQKERKSGASFGEAAPAFFGLTPAPASITRSPLRQALVEYQREHMPRAARTKEQAAVSAVRRDIRDAERRHDSEALQEAEARAREGGLLSSRQIAKVGRAATAGTGIEQPFKSLPFAEAVRIYKLGDAQERAALRKALRHKISSRSGLEHVAFRDRAALLAEARKLVEAK